MADAALEDQAAEDEVAAAHGACCARAAEAQPMSVGRMFADDPCGAGRPLGLHGSGESFLGLLEGLEAVGINVVATRHEGAAAFMAEAHAPAHRSAGGVPRTRAGALNLAIGIHTASADSSPMFALIGQVERAARGREGFQEIDVTATIGRLRSGRRSRRYRPIAAAAQAVDQALTGRPGSVVLSLAEDLLDEQVPAGWRRLPRVPPPRPTDDEVRDVLHARSRAPGDPRRCRRPSGSYVERPHPARGAPAGARSSRPGVAVTSSRTTTRCTSA